MKERQKASPKASPGADLGLLGAHAGDQLAEDLFAVGAIQEDQRLSDVFRSALDLREEDLLAEGGASGRLAAGHAEAHCQGAVPQLFLPRGQVEKDHRKNEVVWFIDSLIFIEIIMK